MAKMKIAPKDRPKAKAELLRVLASHKLDPARTRLLGLFIDQYLVMSASEMKVFEREVAGFAPAERQATVKTLTSWELKGKQTGLHEGKEDVIIRQLRKRFGTVTNEIIARIDRLSLEQLSDLSEALLDFMTIADLEKWLAS